jgi:hypothetical protein
MCTLFINDVDRRALRFVCKALAKMDRERLPRDPCIRAAFCKEYVEYRDGHDHYKEKYARRGFMQTIAFRLLKALLELLGPGRVLDSRVRTVTFEEKAHDEAHYNLPHLIVGFDGTTIELEATFRPGRSTLWIATVENVDDDSNDGEWHGCVYETMARQAFETLDEFPGLCDMTLLPRGVKE